MPAIDFLFFSTTHQRMRIVNRRAPMPSDGLSFDRHRPSNIKNENTGQFVPPPHSSHSAFTPISENGAQTQSLHNGQFLPPVGLSQQTQNTWHGHLGTGNGGKRGDNWAVNVSPALDTGQTQMFPSPVNSQCNRYGSSSQPNDEHRPGFSMPNHA